MVVKELAEINQMHNLLTLKQIEVKEDLHKLEEDMEESEQELSDSNAEPPEDLDVAVIH